MFLYELVNGFGCFWVKVVDEAFEGELIIQGESLKGREKQPQGGILIKSFFEVIYKERRVSDEDLEDTD